jgi:hypothetical protein
VEITRSHLRIAMAIVPAACALAAFELFLGHRHDYAGHFLAGYGGTLGAFMFWLRLVPPERFATWSLLGNLPTCAGCIALGACAEATVFRIAKFDEIDFCNQSLGAVLAAVVVISYASPAIPPAWHFDVGLIIGIAFLGAGGCFAVM